jgi:DNA-binding response OmpR family regulator
LSLDSGRPKPALRPAAAQRLERKIESMKGGIGTVSRDTINFGPYRLESGPDRLWRGSEEVALRPKGLSTLAYLARHPNRLVTNDELRE